MKYFLSILIIAISFSGINAQNKSGKIIYQEVINTKPDMKKAEEQGWAQWADMVPLLQREEKTNYCGCRARGHEARGGVPEFCG